MAKFRTPFTSIEEKNPIAEIVIGKSDTVPDQSLTVREILKKYASGTLDDLSRDLDFSEDMPDLRGLDITELTQLKRDAQMDIDEIQAMIDMHEQVVSPTPDPSPSVPPTTETPDHI